MHTPAGRHLRAVWLLGCLLPTTGAAQLVVENNQKIYHPTGQGSFGVSIAVADMNGDGLQDLVIGNPEQLFVGKFSDIPNAGEIAIVPYQQGQFPGDAFFWVRYRQSSTQPPNFIGRIDADDFFGHAVATGDFNADGLADIVIGAPGDHFSVDGMPIRLSLGSITVGYQTATGSSFISQRVWRQAAPNVQSQQTSIVPGNAEDGERFGWALAVGDFDGDGVDDLAVGVPGETLNGSANATGAVNVIFGSPSGGLIVDGAQFIHQATPGIVGAAEAGDEFGHALTAGNFNCDAYDDLVVGIHKEDIGNETDSGAAVVLYGGPSGLDSGVLPSASFHQGRSDVTGSAEPGDRLGSSLASGDFNGDGCDDLAVGIPFEDVDPFGAAGAVAVFYGSAVAGLTADGNELITGGWAEELESGDRFGASLATGDFNADGKDDLVIGVPGEEYDGGPTDSGAVNILYGSDAGLVAAGSEVWHSGTPGILGDPQPTSEFGTGLATGRLNLGDKDDLLIGVPWDPPEWGSVNILLTNAPFFLDGFESN
ncbi:MAG: hypothetical protein Kow0020_11420 [Wenzhouxiangellaceae bacterium]